MLALPWTTRPLPATVSALAALLLLSSSALAQTDHPAAFDVQLFQPSPSPRSIFNLDLPSIPSHLSFTASLWGNYVPRALVLQRGDARESLVGRVLATDVQLSLGLFEYFEVGASLPLTSQDAAHEVHATHALDLSPSTAFSVGDLRAFVKVPLLRGRTSLALRMSVSFPTGDTQRFAGSASWTFAPAVLVAHTLGKLTLAANAGFRLHDRNAVQLFEVNDELLLSLGARYDLSSRVSLLGEFNAWFTLNASTGRDAQIPAEAMLGAQFGLTRALNAYVGLGRGITSGYGSPDVRVLAGVRLTTERTPCAYGPEDYDGFQDGDYCGDPDNDGDGIADEADRCPNDREDRDDFLDADGCPDPDNDADGLLDDTDRCPNLPEDHDGFETDGCPEPDNDRDGIEDLLDACPNEAEDPDRYQDEDGCPEPGPDAATVTRTESRLLVSQRIFFDFDSDTIRNVSFPIMDAVVAALREGQDILRLRVEGYTDAQGGTDYNLDLSFRRARAVMDYLAAHGIARDRLEFQGFGATHPVADDATPEGQALNRRVEFTILQQAGHTAPTPATAPGTPAAPPRRHHGHRRH